MHILLWLISNCSSSWSHGLSNLKHTWKMHLATIYQKLKNKSDFSYFKDKWNNYFLFLTSSFSPVLSFFLCLFITYTILPYAYLLLLHPTRPSVCLDKTSYTFNLTHLRLSACCEIYLLFSPRKYDIKNTKYSSYRSNDFFFLFTF